MGAVIIASIVIVAIVAFFIGHDRGEKRIISQIRMHKIERAYVSHLPDDIIRHNVIKATEEHMVKEGLITYIEEDGIKAARITFYTWDKSK